MEWNMREQGPRVVVEVWRPDSDEGLYKAYLTGPDGRFLLGTLIPEEGRLFLRRTITIDTLRRQGAWPVTGAEEVLAVSFREDAGSIQWEDVVLRQCVGNLPQHTLRREGENFSLSFPFDPRAPFPLVPAFCFARLEGGQLVFSFRRGGLPYLPSKT